MKRTQVGIVGAGPAGLLLSHLLAREGIASVVLEDRSRSYVEGRIRAGVLEHQTAEILRTSGVGERMDRECMVHTSIDLAFGGAYHRIELERLSGRTITVYGQHEVVKDLIARRLEDGGEIVFEAGDVALRDLESGQPRIEWTKDGARQELACDLVAGCDGYYGVSRASIPDGALTVYDRAWPYAWFGVLAEAAPTRDDLVYSRHENGFSLYSMRSPTITRLYLQCAPDEDAEAWSDEAIWDELHRRLEVGDCDWRINEGPILQKNVAPMRSFVCEPMRHGHLFLAGDAAHIVPPTGAKGMNLAVADVQVLAAGMLRFFRDGDEGGLERYSDVCLDRVWKVQRFSAWMTGMLHRHPDAEPFDERLQLAELYNVVGSRAASTVLAENYVGLPLEVP